MALSKSSINYYCHHHYSSACLDSFKPITFGELSFIIPSQMNYDEITLLPSNLQIFKVYFEDFKGRQHMVKTGIPIFRKGVR